MSETTSQAAAATPPFDPEQAGEGCSDYGAAAAKSKAWMLAALDVLHRFHGMLEEGDPCPSREELAAMFAEGGRALYKAATYVDLMVTYDDLEHAAPALRQSGGAS